MIAGGGTGSISIAPGRQQIRKAKRRQTRVPSVRITGCGRAPDLSFLRVRAGREGALACRRSTAALAAANQRRRSAPARASWDAVGAHNPDGSQDRALFSGRYPLPSCPSPASSSQTGHRAGRA